MISHPFQAEQISNFSRIHLDFILLFEFQLSAFGISSAIFSVATVNNKTMLLLLSVFPILLLLFALELELFALAILTQVSHSPKLL